MMEITKPWLGVRLTGTCNWPLGGIVSPYGSPFGVLFQVLIWESCILNTKNNYIILYPRLKYAIAISVINRVVLVFLVISAEIRLGVMLKSKPIAYRFVG